MVWRGVIIEESLEDKSLLKLVKIVKTKESTLQGEEEKGVWHFHAYDVADKDIGKFAEKAKKAIKEKWWIHAINGSDMIVILRGKIFHHKRGNEKTLKEMRDYVAGQGILQLPEESQMEHPYH